MSEQIFIFALILIFVVFIGLAYFYATKPALEDREHVNL